MKAAIRALPNTVVGALIIGSVAIAPAHAQAPAAPEGPRYVATYVEVMPTATRHGAALVRQFRDASRKEAGNLRLEAAQRVGWPNQFVILEAWRDQAALDAHARAASTAQFHDKLKPLENAPYDDRVTYALAVGPLPPKLSALPGAAIVVVTHVDVVPTYKDSATALVKQLAEDGREGAGNLRYEALTQVSRPNHFTVVAAWRGRKAVEAYSMNARTRAFRRQLAPMAGALYDERYYKVLD